MLTAIYIHYTQKWLCLQRYIFTEVIIYTLARAPRWPQQTSIAHPGKDAQPIQKSHHFPKTWQENRLSKGKPNYLNLFSAKCSYLWAFLNLRLFNPPNCRQHRSVSSAIYLRSRLISLFSSLTYVDLTLTLETTPRASKQKTTFKSHLRANLGSLTFLCNLVCQ